VPAANASRGLILGRLPWGLVNPDRNLELTTGRYLDHLLADSERFAVALEHGPLDAAVAGCPGWDLIRLAEHLGQIHRWAEFCASHGRRPSADEAQALESFDPSAAADWLRDGAARLAHTLRSLDPNAPTWHPFPGEQVASFWPRRQAHETAVHRWDAEHAVGLPATLDPALASDGIDEYLEIVVPRLATRGSITLPTGSLHLHCVDVPGEWLMWSDDGGYRMIRAHEKGDAALRGPAEAILLTLWGRTPAGADALSPVGDEAVLDAWLAIGGA
jgi:uncharacterized protein (TIGR03083 family)